MLLQVQGGEQRPQTAKNETIQKHYYRRIERENEMKSEHFDTVSGDFQEFIQINTTVVYFVTLWGAKVRKGADQWQYRV